MQQKIDEMKRMRDEAKELEQRLDESGQSQISLTDPDSRMMPAGGDRRADVCFNVQVCVDEKHKPIPDRDLLSTMAKRVK